MCGISKEKFDDDHYWSVKGSYNGAKIRLQAVSIISETEREKNSRENSQSMQRSDTYAQDFPIKTTGGDNSNKRCLTTLTRVQTIYRCLSNTGKLGSSSRMFGIHTRKF